MSSSLELAKCSKIHVFSLSLCQIVWYHGKLPRRILLEIDVFGNTNGKSTIGKSAIGNTTWEEYYWEEEFHMMRPPVLARAHARILPSNIDVMLVV